MAIYNLNGQEFKCHSLPSILLVKKKSLVSYAAWYCTLLLVIISFYYLFFLPAANESDVSTVNENTLPSMLQNKVYSNIFVISLLG